MRDNTKRFFASYASLIPLETEEDLKHGYEFVWDKSINSDVKDCMLQVCSNLDIKFGSQSDKNKFLDGLTIEACELFVVWTNTYSDFDISTNQGRDEFYHNLIGEAKILAREYGYDEEEQELLRLRDKEWESQDYVIEKDLNILREFSINE